MEDFVLQLSAPDKKATLANLEIHHRNPTRGEPMNLKRVIRTKVSIAIFSALIGLMLPLIAAAQGKIAFASTRDGNYEIYVMNPDGSSQTRLTNNSVFDGRPSFSRDGTRIAFNSQPASGFSDIFVMNADGTNQVNVTNQFW